MGMHSWMGNEMESLWSVISYLGSRIVPGSLVQTISSIIAVKKKIQRAWCSTKNFMNFFLVFHGWLFFFHDDEKYPMQKS